MYSPEEREQITTVLAEMLVGTKQEQIRAENGVKAYDLMDVEQEEAERKETEIIHLDWTQEHKKTMLEECLAEMQFCQDDIALMTRIREGAEGETLRLCNYFIGNNLLEIQRLKSEMEGYR